MPKQAETKKNCEGLTDEQTDRQTDGQTDEKDVTAMSQSAYTDTKSKPDVCILSPEFQL